MNAKKRTLLMLMAIIGFRSMAQNAPFPLSLDSVIQMSLRQSRQLKVDNAKVDAARARYQQARSLSLPTARLSASYTRLSDNVDPFGIRLPGSSSEKVLNPQILNHYTPALSVGQTIYAGGQIKYAEKSMQLLEEASRLDLANNRTAVIYNSISACFNLFRLQQTKAAVEENIRQVKGHARDIVNYEKNGLALRNDVLKVELQLSDLEHSLIEINSALDIADYNMSILLGLPTGSSYLLIPADYAPTVTLKAQEEYLGEAMISRADLRSVNRRIGSALMDLRSAAGNYFPTLSLGANYYYTNPNQRVFPQENKFKGTWDAGITVSWNIHSLYTNKHRMAEGKAQVAQRLSERDGLTDGIKTEVNSNYITYLKEKEKTRVSQQAVRQAEENYRIVNNRFRNNTVLISDLTDANTLLLQAKINLLVDQADAGLAYYKLLQSTGSIN